MENNGKGEEKKEGREGTFREACCKKAGIQWGSFNNVIE